MLKSYWTIACRILARQKVFSLVNIMGLAIGIAACLLITQYITFEASFDNFHRHGANIYRLKHQNYQQGNLIENLPYTYSAVGPALKSEFPQVQEVTRVGKMEGMVAVRQPNGSLIMFNEKNLYQADASFLKIFTFPMQSGSEQALAAPNSVVITQGTAKKYFPNQDPIGKTINLQEQTSGTNITATVTGVCEDVPANSHLQFDFLFSNEAAAGDWIFPGSYTYILLSPAADPKALEARLPAFIKKYTRQSTARSNSTNTLGKSNLANITLSLQPLRSIHLYSNLSNEISAGGNGNMVWYLGIVAALILMIAYVNYVNLSTAKVIERAKEVGIRKVLGSQRWQLIKQFLLESILLNIISLVVAIFLVLLAMPWFSLLCGVPLSFTIWKNIPVLAGFTGILSAGVLLSAIYPALILSNYQPIQVLKGKFTGTAQRLSLRKGLVVFQFVAAIALMIATTVVYRQVNFMKNEGKGMDMKQTLVLTAPQNVRATDDDNQKYLRKDSVFQMEASRDPQVTGVTLSSSIPGETIDYLLAYTSHPPAGGEKTLRLSTCEIGSTYIDMFKLKIVAGSNFSPDRSSAKYPTLILNEAAVTSLGFNNPRDAIGKLVETRNGRGRIFQNEVIGVMQNFHQTSLKDDFTPTVFRLSDPNSAAHYELKVYSNDMPRTIARIEKTYKNIFPESFFEYFFLDDFFDQQYRAEQHFGQVFTLFSAFAIIVACLGLFGLTLITLTQRIKEISIRKILGASTSNILLLISKDFMILIAIASSVAIPLAYWGSYKWLENYKFRIHFTVWYFIFPILLVILIALFTTSYQAIKSSTANPVNGLRME